MKHWFLTISILLSLNIFSQSSIDKSETIIWTKNHISNQIVIGEFYKKFQITKSISQPFITANIILEGTFSKDIEVLVRYKTREWSQWESVVEDFHFNREGSISKEMIYLPQGVGEFEIKANITPEVNSFRVDFFYPEFTENLVSKRVVYNEVKSTQAVDCNCPMPAYEARLDWCPSGNCPAQTIPTYTTVTHLIVHHAAGPNTSTDWAATVRSIWNYHVNSNGWSDIGYNYLVAPDGTIFEGRGDNILGAHFSGMNGGTMGICLLGDYEPTSGNGIPSSIMISKLEELLSWKECDLDIDPLLSSYHSGSSQDLFNISGHRDAGTGTSCPGDNVYNLLPTIRTTCSSYMENCSFVAEADLVVSAVSINPSPAFLSQDVTIDYAIGNVGALSVEDSIKVELKIDGVLVETSYLDSLSDGNIANFSLSNFIFDEIGDHSICVYISEASNETNVVNNSYCKTVNIQEENTESDIEVSSFLIQNEEINLAEEAIVNFSFKNIGAAMTSESVIAKIRIDNVLNEAFSIPVLAENEVFTKNFTHDFNTVGEYQICINVNSATNESNVVNNSACKTIRVSSVSDLEKLNSVVQLKVFPNPVESLLQIHLTLNKQETIVYEFENVLGQSLFSKISDNSLAHQEKIDVSRFAAGIYFLNIKIGNQSINKTIFLE